MNLISNEANPIKAFGSDVTLTCTVKVSEVVVESNVTEVDVQLTRNGERQNLTILAVTGTTFTYTTQLNSFGVDKSGNYICSAIVVPNPPNNTHLTANGSVMDSIQVSTG